MPDNDLSSGTYAIPRIRSLFQRAVATLLPYTNPDAASTPSSNRTLDLLGILPSPEMLDQRARNEQLWTNGEIAELERSWRPVVDRKSVV